MLFLIILCAWCQKKIVFMSWMVVRTLLSIMGQQLPRHCCWILCVSSKNSQLILPMNTRLAFYFSKKLKNKENDKWISQYAAILNTSKLDLVFVLICFLFLKRKFSFLVSFLLILMFLLCGLSSARVSFKTAEEKYKIIESVGVLSVITSLSYCAKYHFYFTKIKEHNKTVFKLHLGAVGNVLLDWVILRLLYFDQTIRFN